MKRGQFIFSILTFFPLAALAKALPPLAAKTLKGFKVSSGEARFGEHFKMKGITSNILDIKISSKDTDGSLAVFEQNGFNRNGGPPLHIHLLQDEFFYIINGEYLFQVGEETYSLKPGDTIFLPKTIPHAFVQLTDTGRVLVSFMPAGKIEDFFKTTDSWTSPPTMKEIETAFEEHDMKIAGPPLNAHGKKNK